MASLRQLNSLIAVYEEGSFTAASERENATQSGISQHISAIEKELGIKAKIEFSPMQPGDVKKTAADSYLLDNIINFRSKTSLALGLKKYIQWYNSYYG